MKEIKETMGVILIVLLIYQTLSVLLETLWSNSNTLILKNQFNPSGGSMKKDKPLTTDNLKELAKHLKIVAMEALTKSPPEPQKHEILIKFVRQLEAIGYSDMLFRDLLKDYETNFSLLGEKKKNLPLHINDNEILSEELILWRLSNNL